MKVSDHEGSTPALRVGGLSMGYRQSGEWLPVLRELSFQVRRGEFVCILGPSGCGKTTLLRLVAGLEKPSEGGIWLEGLRVDKPRRDVGLVFQEPTLMAWRTVEGNIALPLEVEGTPGHEIELRARELTELVGLSGFEEAYPAQLSGGMAQRTALARALIHNPQLLLLDEPFGALDALTRERMAQELLRIWQARRKTVLMVTHSISEAVFLADRVLVLSPRPASVLQDVSIPLRRPRSESTLQSTAFAEFSHRLREALGVTET